MKEAEKFFLTMLADALYNPPLSIILLKPCFGMAFNWRGSPLYLVRWSMC